MPLRCIRGCPFQRRGVCAPGAMLMGSLAQECLGGVSWAKKVGEVRQGVKA